MFNDVKFADSVLITAVHLLREVHNYFGSEILVSNGGTSGTFMTITSITIKFKSVDTKEVTVNIKSGGDKIDEVGVPAGETVTWKSNVTALGGKTLYLNRWRQGFLGIPDAAGGSLMLWIPQSSHGGSLQLTAVVNKS